MQTSVDKVNLTEKFGTFATAPTLERI